MKIYLKIILFAIIIIKNSNGFQISVPNNADDHILRTYRRCMYETTKFLPRRLVLLSLCSNLFCENIGTRKSSFFVVEKVPRENDCLDYLTDQCVQGDEETLMYRPYPECCPVFCDLKKRLTRLKSTITRRRWIYGYQGPYPPQASYPQSPAYPQSPSYSSTYDAADRTYDQNRKYESDKKIDRDRRFDYSRKYSQERRREQEKSLEYDSQYQQYQSQYPQQNQGQYYQGQYPYDTGYTHHGTYILSSPTNDNANMRTNDNIRTSDNRYSY